MQKNVFENVICEMVAICLNFNVGHFVSTSMC